MTTDKENRAAALALLRTLLKQHLAALGSDLIAGRDTKECLDDAGRNGAASAIVDFAERRLEELYR